MAGLGARAFFLVFFSLAAVTALPATVLIGQKERHCFYAYAERATRFKAEVFVFQGGALDIGFSVHGPTSFENGILKPNAPNRKWRVQHEAKVVPIAQRAVDDESKPAVYDYEFAAITGEYEICLSNDRRFEQDAKHVMLSITEVDGDGKEINGKQSKDETPVDPEDGNSDLRVITKQAEKLTETIEDIEKRQTQERFRLTHREIAAQDNHTSIVRSSVMETVVLVVVSIGQIIFVRRWFQGKGTLLKQWS